MSFKLGSIIGLKVVSIKGEHNAKGKHIEPVYILFDDKKTILHLEEQDYYTYRDYSTDARILTIAPTYPQGIFQEELWEVISKYPDATVDI